MGGGDSLKLLMEEIKISLQFCVALLFLIFPRNLNQICSAISINIEL